MYNSEYSTENIIIRSNAIPFFVDEIKAQAFTLNVLNWTRGLLTEKKSDVVVSISQGANDNALTIDIEFPASALMTGVSQMQTLQERIMKNLKTLLSKKWTLKHPQGNNFSLFMHQRKLTLYEIIFLEESKPEPRHYTFYMNKSGKILCLDCAEGSIVSSEIDREEYPLTKSYDMEIHSPICDICKSIILETDLSK